MYKKAIVIVEQTLGKDHPKLATRYNNLAGVYQAQASSCELPPWCLMVREGSMGVSNPWSISNTWATLKYAVIVSSTPRRT